MPKKTLEEGLQLLSMFDQIICKAEKIASLNFAYYLEIIRGIDIAFNHIHEAVFKMKYSEQNKNYQSIYG